jgi:hypothetical protein
MVRVCNIRGIVRRTSHDTPSTRAWRCANDGRTTFAAVPVSAMPKGWTSNGYFPRLLPL